MAMYNGHMRQVTATEYKHNALKLLEQVHQTGETIQITKRGKAYAELKAVAPQARLPRQLGQFEGQMTIVGDIVGPIIDPSEWGDAV